MGLLKFLEPVEKGNPAQGGIQSQYGEVVTTTQLRPHTVASGYRHTEVVNRSMNILVDSTSMLRIIASESIEGVAPVVNVRHKKVFNMLRYKPNPYQDVNNFKRLIFMDLLAEGNIFMYFDGEGLYHLPAINVEILTDDKTYVKGYRYNITDSYRNPREVHFLPEEIIHVRDNSIANVYRGYSRVLSTLESLGLRDDMQVFRKSFFSSGAAIGLVMETENILSKRLKERTELEWLQKFKPSKSGRPMILDNGMKAKAVTDTNFNSMGFNDSFDSLENRIAIGIGVPPILLLSGNNANIRPNVDLMFSFTILPAMRKVVSALERYFGYNIEIDSKEVPLLEPDQKDLTERIVSQVNNGIITGNEGRIALGLPPREGDPAMEIIRIPANVSGSATNVTGQEGGAPTHEEDGDDTQDEDSAGKSMKAFTDHWAPRLETPSNLTTL